VAKIITKRKSQTFTYILIGLAIGVALYFILRKPEEEQKKFSGGYYTSTGNNSVNTWRPDTNPIQAPDSIGTRS